MPATQSAQNFVDVREVRGGLIVLNDGSYRGILMCSSINFALKSADEQQAIIQGFQGFLSTLDFSVQILAHSRRMDIRPYLALLQTRENKQQTELMRIQVREYIGFIRSFTENANIMSKTFYIVVPYSPAIIALPTTMSSIPFFGGKKKKGDEKQSGFEEQRAQLEQRMSVVASGLSGSGVRAVPLGTEEVVELLYRSYNPGELETPIHYE